MAQHLFNHCTFSKAQYEEMKRALPGRMNTAITATPNIQDLTSARIPVQYKSIVLTAQFLLWQEQCARTFTDNSKGIQELKNEILWQIQFYEARSHTTAAT